VLSSLAKSLNTPLSLNIYFTSPTCSLLYTCLLINERYCVLSVSPHFIYNLSSLLLREHTPFSSTTLSLAFSSVQYRVLIHIVSRSISLCFNRSIYPQTFFSQSHTTFYRLDLLCSHILCRACLFWFFCCQQSILLGSSFDNFLSPTV